jgi:hypothetical protein
MRASVVRLCGLIAIAGTAACSDSSTAVAGCSTESLRPAIIVQVAAASGPAIKDTLARGIVRDGDYSDSLRIIQIAVAGLSSLGAAVNRPGTYDVMVEHPGYLPWEKDSVVVAASPCGIKQSVNLVADLQPAP